MLGKCWSLGYDSLGRNMENSVCFSSAGEMNLRLELYNFAKINLQVAWITPLEGR